jgi:ferric-dicitrate binding protein FerR (iron transport regulator)
MEVDVPRPDRRSQARIEALAWYLALDTTKVSSATLEGFFEWRREPINRAVYEAVEDEARGARPTLH